MKDLIQKINTKIQKGESLSPFLFMWNNLELINSKIYDFSLDLMKQNWVDKINLYKLEDNGEIIKLDDIKKFLVPSKTIANSMFQIFFIENVSRMTTWSFNSCLKFFEEPWNKNLIFLTNKWESSILDTILSRVEKIYLNSSSLSYKDEFYYNLISKSFSWNFEIISYFYRNKQEKEDIVKFLRNIIIYSKDNFVFLEYLEDLNSDIEAILKNNVNAKFILDKWIIILTS